MRILEPLQSLVTLTAYRCMTQLNWMKHELGCENDGCGNRDNGSM